MDEESRKLLSEWMLGIRKAIELSLREEGRREAGRDVKLQLRECARLELRLIRRLSSAGWD